MENGNGFPLSMKVAYAKDLLVAKVAGSPTEAVAMVEHLMKGFGAPAPAVEKIPGSGPYPQPEKAAAPAKPEANDTGAPDLHADVVTVKGWAKEPKSGANKNGRGNWWKLGVKVYFQALKAEEWITVWSAKKAEFLQKNKNQNVGITYSVGAYNGKPQYTLEGIDGMEE